MTFINERTHKHNAIFHEALNNNIKGTLPGNVMELNIPSYVLSDHFTVAITRNCNHNIIIIFTASSIA